MGSSKRGKSTKNETKESNAFDNNILLKHLLKNAIDFQGKPNPKAVIGTILREKPAWKQNISSLLNEIEALAAEVSSFPIEEQRKKLQSLAPELLQVALQEKEFTPEGPLKPLAHAEQGNAVLRIAPSPSGALHIGHAYGASLNYEYAKMYKGKLILRIEDTNPENIYPPAYELVENDARWLTDNGISEVIIQSSRLGLYYDYAEKVVQLGKAYVCICNPDHWREEKNRGIACPCRSISPKENELRYAKMFNEYAEGEAVLRLKTDIRHKNPAMRDFAIMRIVEHIHPKTGKEQRVWPLMVFAVAIDDHELGVTHVLNGKDHTDNAAKERMIMDCFSWNHPEYRHWGRINFEGFVLSSTETRIAIEQGEYKGWDDIRIPFLPALRRRGYQAEAFRKYAMEIGLSLNDKTVSREEFWKNINAFNRHIIEPMANRYFFVDDPVTLEIKNFPKKNVEMALHPDFPERGKRIFSIKGAFAISLSDFRRLSEGYVHRLMDCGNFMLKGEHFEYVPGNYHDYKNAAKKGHIIHWLPAGDVHTAEVFMDDDTVRSGLGEKSLTILPEGTIVQLERRFFARVDTQEKKKTVLWHLHA